MAAVARRLCTCLVDPKGLESFVTCRLIPLDKCPGVRPIGIGEVPRRLIAKSVLMVLKTDIIEASGSLQLCAGQEAGSEAAIHAMRSIFSGEECEAVLLVDAKNAFNTLSRQATLHNIRIICPAFSTILINTYRSHIKLLMQGGEHIFSEEGTTQGDPLAMAMYALGIYPLITQLCGPARQVWFADDATAAGSIKEIKKWWDTLVSSGGAFGYETNPSKTWLIVKEEFYDEAMDIFETTGIGITINGKRHLGAAIGKRLFVEEYVTKKVEEWVDQVHRLSTIAKTQPHAAYAAA